jgi:hypothetical protein
MAGGAWLTLAVHTGPALAAGGAYAVDDAEVGKPGDCKVEMWGSFADNQNRIGVVQPACVFDIFRPVELSAQFLRFRAEGEWGTDLAIKGKTNIIPVEVGQVGLGFIAGAAFDLLTGDNTAIFATVPLTYQPIEPVKLNLNAGVSWDRIEDRAFFLWGAGIDWTPAERLMLTAEIFGAGQNDPRFQAGIRLTPKEWFDIDLIYGRNITGEDANWITVGLTVRFEPFAQPAGASAAARLMKR